MLVLATFLSTHATLRAEQELTGEVPVELIPVPRQIRSDCGFALLASPLDPSGAGRAVEILKGHGATGLWRVIELDSPTSRHKEKHYEPIP
jgi:hypothetical protein